MVRSYVLVSIQPEFLQEFFGPYRGYLLQFFEEVEVAEEVVAGELLIALLVYLAFGMCSASVVVAEAGEEVLIS